MRIVNKHNKKKEKQNENKNNSNVNFNNNYVNYCFTSITTILAMFEIPGLILNH